MKLSCFRPSLLSLSLASALLAPGAFAQNPSAQNAQGDTPEILVVTQTPVPGLAQSADRYPGHVQVVSDNQIERSKSANLPEFMQQQLGGVTVNSVQGSPLQTDILYRGHRLSPTLGNAQGLSVYVDGVRVNEAFGDVMNWDLLPESALGSLAMMPGSNPLFGLNTLGGALVLTTKSGLTHAGTEGEVSLGSFGRRRFDFSHGQRWQDGWHGLVAGTLFGERGWRERSQGRLGNLFVKLGQKRGDSDWSLSYTHAKSTLNGNGLLSQSLYNVSSRLGYTFQDTTVQRADTLQARLVQTLNASDQLTLLAWQRKSSRQAVTGDIHEDWVESLSDTSNPPYTGYTSVQNRHTAEQTSTGASAQWSRKTASQRMAFGLEASRSRVAYDQYTQEGSFDDNRLAVPDSAAPQNHSISLRGTSQTLSLYATDTLALDLKTELTLSARYNQTRVGNDLGQPAPLTSEAFTYQKLNPAVGLSHAWDTSTVLFASLSQGTRVPTALELGCADPSKPCTLPTGLQADPYLKQVVARTLEVGAKLKMSEHVRLSGALFRTISEDDIVFVRSGVSQQGYFTNIGRTQRQGLELSARAKQGSMNWRMDYLFLDATYQSAGELPGPLTATTPNTFGKGTQLAGLPRHVLKLGGEWQASKAVLLGFDGVLSGSQVVAGNEGGQQSALGKLAGYGVWNAKAIWQWQDRWQFWSRVNNVFDQKYANFAAGNFDLFPKGQAAQAGDTLSASRFLAPGAGRSLMVGVRYDFD